MKKDVIKVYNGGYFLGNKISNYGLTAGYVDYYCLRQSIDAVLNNDIIQKTNETIGYWETVNGSELYYWDNETNDYIDYNDIENWDNIDEYYYEIYQYYIISEAGYNILSEYTDEIVFYNDVLDMYVWGVCHYGTAWDYVLTDIKIEVVE
jgi:hypothetical protein